MSYIFWIAVFSTTCLGLWFLYKWNERRNSVQVYTPQDEGRQEARLQPYFRREIVEAKVKSLFPNHNSVEILKLLDSVVVTFGDLERMQLDILKLSNGDLDQLRHYIELAGSERDFIKVSELAEQPESSRANIAQKDLFWGDHKRMIERDFRQYLNWLKQE